MIQYPNLDLYFTEIFPLIYKYLASEIDPIPKYEDQKLGMEQLRGILERIQTKHYSTFYEKAAYLYLGIIKGHYFSNGNKRLAVLSFAFFYEMNAYKLKIF